MALYEHIYLARQDVSPQQVEELTNNLTEVLTHGFLGRTEEELDRKEFEERLNQLGGEGWEFDKLLTHVALHGERDGHLLIFKRATG